MTDWLKLWNEDLDYLAAELPYRHLNLFHNLAEQAFVAQIERLRGELADCDAPMVITRLMALVASAGDAHTTLIPTVDNYLPFEFYWFAEGLHIVAAQPDQQAWLGARLLAIDGLPVAEVIDTLTSILSHENHSFVAAQLPYYLTAVDLLYGLEICESLASVKLTLEKPAGAIAFLEVPTVRHNESAGNLIRLAGPGNDPAGSSQSDTEIPLYRQRRGHSLWFTPVGPEAIYVQYNSCHEQPDQPVAAVIADLLAMAGSRQPDKLIIDLRHNGGGNSTLLEPLIQELAGSFQIYFGQVYVIIGRDTFSSALLNAYALKNQAGAWLVGEPTGGKPNCYGEVKYLTLPHSRLQVRYSTSYYHLVEDDALLSLAPDLPCPVTLADYLAGRDPCLEAILKADDHDFPVSC